MHAITIHSLSLCVCIYRGVVGQNGGGGGNNVTNNVATNGYSDQNSPNSSQISSEGQQDAATQQLISRTQKQHTTQQVRSSYFYLTSRFYFDTPKKVTTTTKTIREIQYLGPDGQPLEVVPGQPPPVHPRISTSSNPYEPYNGPPQQPVYSGGGAAGDYEQFNNHGHPNYAEYPHRPPTPPSPSDRSVSPPPQHREPGECKRLIKIKRRMHCVHP